MVMDAAGLNASGELIQEVQLAGKSRVFLELIRRPASVAAISVIVGLAVAALGAPLFAPYSPNASDFNALLSPPSWHHLFGTDELGRDLFSRILYGGRIDIGVMFASTCIAMVTALIWGASAAMFSGWVDDVLMRIADALMAMPSLVLALVFAAAFGSSIPIMIGIIGLILAPWAARVIRVAVIGERHLDYCTAAASYGSPRWRTLCVEIFPNISPILVIQAALIGANVILFEAVLSFIGLGVQPPAASWGTLLELGYAHVQDDVWYGLFPGLVIFAAILSLNTIADHLQDILDPRRGGS